MLNIEKAIFMIRDKSCLRVNRIKFVNNSWKFFFNFMYMYTRYVYAIVVLEIGRGK